jgi:hypothetical protein
MAAPLSKASHRKPDLNQFHRSLLGLAAGHFTRPGRGSSGGSSENDIELQT